MTTQKEAAAVALATCIDGIVSELERDTFDRKTVAEVMRVATAQFRVARTQPARPELSELEREYMEACYAAGCGSTRPCPEKAWDRVTVAQATLHAHRTAKADPLREARDKLAEWRGGWDGKDEVLHLLDAALSQRVQP